MSTDYRTIPNGARVRVVLEGKLTFGDSEGFWLDGEDIYLPSDAGAVVAIETIEVFEHGELYLDARGSVYRYCPHEGSLLPWVLVNEEILCSGASPVRPLVHLAKEA